MREIRFRLPANLPVEAAVLLRQAYLARGAELCPIASRAEITREELVLRTQEEDGPVNVCIPWSVCGEVWMLSTTTLLPDVRPYDLVRELARGQLYRVRCVAESWTDAGLELPSKFHEQLRQAVRDLLMSAGRDIQEGQQLAERSLETALATGQALTLETCRWLAQARQQRLPVPLYVSWSASTEPNQEYDWLRESFDGVCLPCLFDPRQLENETYWQQKDRQLNWWRQRGWAVCLGPIFDFASETFQKYWRQSSDWEPLAEQAELFLTRLAHRYREEVLDWQVVAAANFFPTSLSLQDGLTMLERLLRPVRRLLAEKQVSIGLAQPWGERAAHFPEQPVPLLLADWLARANAGVTALDLELIFGCEPRGSGVRPPLAISQLLDWFSELPLEIHLSLGLPASRETDALADPPDQDVSVPATEQWQSAWAATLLDLGLAHSRVRRITWLDASDAAPHLVPHGGLCDIRGRPRPVLEAFRQRRARTSA